MDVDGSQIPETRKFVWTGIRKIDQIPKKEQSQVQTKFSPKSSFSLIKGNFS